MEDTRRNRRIVMKDTRQIVTEDTRWKRRIVMKDTRRIVTEDTRRKRRIVIEDTRRRDGLSWKTLDGRDGLSQKTIADRFRLSRDSPKKFIFITRSKSCSNKEAYERQGGALNFIFRVSLGIRMSQSDHEVEWSIVTNERVKSS
jgi:hypothetical protein